MILKTFSTRLRFLIFCIVIINMAGNLRAQSDPELVIHFFESLYNYQFTTAKKQLESIRKNFPDSDYLSISESNYYWWLYVSGNQNAVEESLLKKSLTKIINRYSETDPNKLSQDELFAVVHAYAYKARLALSQKKRFEALSMLSKIHPYLKRILDHPETNDKIRLLAGLYNYVAAVTYEEYFFSRPFLKLLPKADKELGYRLLIKASQSNHPLIQTEAAYFLMKIQLEITQHFQQAGYWSKQLLKKYPDNLIYLFYQLQIYSNSGKNKKARKVLSVIRQKSASIKGLNREQRHHIISESKEYLEEMR